MIASFNAQQKKGSNVKPILRNIKFETILIESKIYKIISNLVY